MPQIHSRRLFGLIVVVAAALVLDLLPSAKSPTYLLFDDQYVFIPTVWSILVSLSVFALGGFVARSRFVPIAAAAAVLAWIFAQYVLYQIAAVAGQADIVATAIGNAREKTMKAVWNDTEIANSDDTVVVEGNHYFPLSSVNSDYLFESDKHTICPWKGQASYYDIAVGDEVNEGAAWYYSDPKPSAAELSGRVAFWRGIEVSE